MYGVHTFGEGIGKNCGGVFTNFVAVSCYYTYYILCRKQELRELKMLQKQEQKQFQDLSFKAQFAKDQQVYLLLFILQFCQTYTLPAI